jgi:hypothetical protein
MLGRLLSYTQQQDHYGSVSRTRYGNALVADGDLDVKVMCLKLINLRTNNEKLREKVISLIANRISNIIEWPAAVS